MRGKGSLCQPVPHLCMRTQRGVPDFTLHWAAPQPGALGGWANPVGLCLTIPCSPPPGPGPTLIYLQMVLKAPLALLAASLDESNLDYNAVLEAWNQMLIDIVRLETKLGDGDQIPGGWILS